MWEDLREFLSHTLLTIGETNLTVSSIFHDINIPYPQRVIHQAK